MVTAPDRLNPEVSEAELMVEEFRQKVGYFYKKGKRQA